MNVELYGYQYSVYSWIARLALEEKGASYHWIEINPFAPEIPESYLALHPFKRVPALVHDKFQIYETGAITRYVDEAFPGPRLQPTDPRHRARCSQFLSIIDSYVYWPLVRQVFSHCVFRLALDGRRMPPKYKRVWTQRLKCLPHWSGSLPTPNISAVPSYPWPTSILRR
jgi:glutathione S-transferase